MLYYNYHAKVKSLIKSGDCLCVFIVEEYHNIKPAMVLYFKSHKPMPIRDYRWDEYLPLIKEYKITIHNPDNIYYEEY